MVGAGGVVALVEDETVGEYTVLYGAEAEKRAWSGRFRVEEDGSRTEGLGVFEGDDPEEVYHNRMHDDVKPSL